MLTIVKCHLSMVMTALALMAVVMKFKNIRMVMQIR